MPEALSFSVAVPTLGRSLEVAALLKSISESTVRPAQVIIVDQNLDDRLDSILLQFPSLALEHRRVQFRGLSAAKNYAAGIASGLILFTPDDDCRVFPDTFQIALDQLARSGADAVFGKCIDESGGDSIVAFRKQSGWLTSETMDGMFVEPATAVRTAVLREIPFDETLGVGTFHGAEEGYDWVLRLLQAKKKLLFQPDIKFFHPPTVVDRASSQSLRRVFSYRCGYGRMCRKHGLWGKYAKRVALVAGGIGAYSIADRKKARYYLAELAGLIAGAVVDP